MQECDLLINSIVPTVQYNKIMDLTTYWLYDYFALVIPVPDETANINAVVKPFQWPVCTFYCLKFFAFDLNKLFVLLHRFG